MDETIGIFPTPVQFSRKAVSQELTKDLIALFESTQTGPNVKTALLSHTPSASPRTHAHYQDVVRQIGPKISAFGETLLGEKLNWGVKEIWINKMEPGGAQKMHNHANSFISGILYLTECDPSSLTVFHRHVGSTSFWMDNTNERSRINDYNSPIFRPPQVEPGDLLLFPSYLMHEVPPNQGAPRLTAAFNAIPEQIESWGYVVRFR